MTESALKQDLSLYSTEVWFNYGFIQDQDQIVVQNKAQVISLVTEWEKQQRKAVLMQSSCADPAFLIFILTSHWSKLIWIQIAVVCLTYGPEWNSVRQNNILQAF